MSISLLGKVLRNNGFKLNMGYEDLYKNQFNNKLFHFTLYADLYANLIKDFENNGFKVFRVSSNNKESIKIIMEKIEK